MSANSNPWSGTRIVPLVVIDDPRQTELLLDSLAEAGLNLVEIALRTPRAMDSIKIATQMGGFTVAAGTVLTPTQLNQVFEAGVDFAVSPSFSEELSDAVSVTGMPWIPGIASASEALAARNRGFKSVKIYPANLLGGPQFVQSLGAVFEDLSFMPSGGVSQENFLDYLSQSNVFAVSGSWIAPRNLIAQGEFAEITRRAKEALEKAK